MARTAFFELAEQLSSQQQQFGADLQTFQHYAGSHQYDGITMKELVTDILSRVRRAEERYGQAMKELESIHKSADDEEARRAYLNHVNRLRREQTKLRSQWYQTEQMFVRPHTAGQTSSEGTLSETVPEQGIPVSAMSFASGQTAVEQATSSRSQDLQRVEREMAELSMVFAHFDGLVIAQDAPIAQLEKTSEGVVQDVEAANVQLRHAEDLIRRRRRVKAILLGVGAGVVVVVGVIVAIIYSLRKK